MVSGQVLAQMKRSVNKLGGVDGGRSTQMLGRLLAESWLDECKTRKYMSESMSSEFMIFWAEFSINIIMTDNNSISRNQLTNIHKFKKICIFGIFDK